MEKDKLIKALNLFLLLEKGQVAIYDAQSKQLEDPYLRQAFIRFRDIESDHVKNITQKLTDLGLKPDEETESLNHPITDLLLDYGGHTAGSILEATGIEKMLKANIAVEQRATKDYFKLIKQVNNEETANFLWQNMIDEELHIAWMENWLRKD